jgi:hypothetical protein
MVEKFKLKNWFESKGLISVIWILVCIFVFEIIFLTTKLQRQDLYFTYISITLSIPLLLYAVHSIWIRKIKKINQTKLKGFFELITTEYYNKDLKRKIIIPLSKMIPINEVSFDAKNHSLLIKIGLIEKISIQFNHEKASIQVEETKIAINLYYKRVNKINDWNGYCNYKILGLDALYSQMLSILKNMITYGCIIEEYEPGSTDERIIAYYDDVAKTIIYDSKNPSTKKVGFSIFKSKPKTYKIAFK